MRRLLFAAGIFGALAGPSSADPALTTASSTMRKAASPYSRAVQAVPANAEVDIRSCGGEWCYGSWRGRYGFLPSFAVAGAAPPPGVASPPPFGFAAPPQPLAVTAPVVVAPAPAYHWSGPYVGVGFGW